MGGGAIRLLSPPNPFLFIGTLWRCPLTQFKAEQLIIGDELQQQGHVADDLPIFGEPACDIHGQRPTPDIIRMHEHEMNWRPGDLAEDRIERSVRGTYQGDRSLTHTAGGEAMRAAVKVQQQPQVISVISGLARSDGFRNFGPARHREALGSVRTSRP